MKKVLFSAAAVLGLLTAAEAGGSAYFYRRTMKRNHVSVERTMKMAGTDWRQYFPLIEERRARLLAKHHEEIYLESFDGLRLHATWFPAEEETEITKAVICFHGYSSCLRILTEKALRHGLKSRVSSNGISRTMSNRFLSV